MSQSPDQPERGHVIVAGHKYEIPPSMTLGEARLIKQIAGIGMAQVEEALANGDPDVVAAIVLIAMRRGGRKIELSDLDLLDISNIEFNRNDEADDPPTVTAAADTSSPPDGDQETTPSSPGDLSTGTSLA